MDATLKDQYTEIALDEVISKIDRSQRYKQYIPGACLDLVAAVDMVRIAIQVALTRIGLEECLTY